MSQVISSKLDNANPSVAQSTPRAASANSPKVTVLRDKKVATPESEREDADLTGAEGRDLRAALQLTWNTDAHCTQYAPVELPFTDGPRVIRLASGAARHLPSGTVRMVALIGDLDDPIAHATDTEARPEWRRENVIRLEASGLGYYQTRGGYRVLAALAGPFVVDSDARAAEWSARYLAWCDAMLGEHGLELDRKCIDWTRLFRLPNVRRDGVPVSAKFCGRLTTVALPECAAVDAPAPARETLGTTHGDVDTSSLEAIADTHAPSVSGQGGDETLLKCATLMANLVPDVDAVLAALQRFNTRCVPPWPPAKLRREATNTVRRARDEAEDPIGGYLTVSAEARAANSNSSAPDDSWMAPATGRAQVVGVATAPVSKRLDHLCDWLVSHDVVAFDDRLGAVVRRDSGRRWSDADTAELQYELASAGFEVPSAKVDSMVALASEQHHYDPVTDYLRSLPPWDGTRRNLLSDYFGAEPGAWADACWRVLSISAVARALEPGCKVDTMVCLEGSQGARKSSGLRALCGAAHFSDSDMPLDPKRVVEGLAGVWIKEVAELSGLRGRDAQKIKASLSSASDGPVRAAYGRHAVTVPRRSIFVATYNPDGAGFLSDSTGNRRYLPIATGAVDVEGIARDRDQLWAEALARHLARESWWLTREEADQHQAAETEKRTEADPWETIIREWIEAADANVAKGIEGAQALTDVHITDVLEHALQLARERQGQREANRAARALKRLGWQQYRNGSSPRRYRRAAPANEGRPRRFPRP